jgi:hypothetical protein
MDLMLHVAEKICRREVAEYMGLVKRLPVREYIPNRNSVLNLKIRLRVHEGVHEDAHGESEIASLNPDWESLY